jgi:hypothetical protein
VIPADGSETPQLIVHRGDDGAGLRAEAGGVRVNLGERLSTHHEALVTGDESVVHDDADTLEGANLATVDAVAATLHLGDNLPPPERAGVRHDLLHLTGGDDRDVATVDGAHLAGPQLLQRLLQHVAVEVGGGGTDLSDMPMRTIVVVDLRLQQRRVWARESMDAPAL